MARSTPCIWPSREHPGAPSSASVCAREVREAHPEPWFALWSALCHQSDVYPASYAAVPHIVSAAAARAPEHRAEYLFLAGTIESMRHKPNSPAMPLGLELSYQRALEAATPLALEALQAEPDASWFQALLGSLAAFRGFAELGAAIAELEREISCPSCEDTFLAPGYDYFA